MVQAWWLGGLALPAVLIRTINSSKKSRAKEEEPIEPRYCRHSSIPYAATGT